MSEASGKMSMGSVESTEDECDEDVEMQAAIASRLAERTILDSFDAEKPAAESLEEDIPWRDCFAEVVLTYAYLGLVSFGGSQAHVSSYAITLLRGGNGWMTNNSWSSSPSGKDCLGPRRRSSCFRRLWHAQVQSGGWQQSSYGTCLS